MRRSIQAASAKLTSASAGSGLFAVVEQRRPGGSCATNSTGSPNSARQAQRAQQLFERRPAEPPAQVRP